ncbi:hypothetical protein VT85_26470 (plasmid) [Planctomyces sp. SH-PL62]|nr:hypothetical protein VT85_26470 [Planctomyces sp. SH-PL62]
MSEVIEPATAAVALSGRVEQRQAAGPAGVEEAGLDRLGEGLRMGGPDEAAAHDGLTVLDDRHSFGRRAKQPLDAVGHDHQPPLTWRVCPVR